LEGQDLSSLFNIGSTFTVWLPDQNPEAKMDMNLTLNA
jgi:hypothetical protein